MTAEAVPLWTPTDEFAAASAMARFMAEVSSHHDVTLSCYDDLWRWSIEHPGDFWIALASFFEVRADGEWTPVRERDDLSGVGWFPDIRINYAEHILRNASTEAPALVALSEDSEPTEVSWADLERQVAAVAGQLREWGVERGDRVVGYLPNIPEAVVALLASASLGAVWCCCGPDLGRTGVVDRFEQIEPTVLVAVNGYRFGGSEVSRDEDLPAIIAALPTLRHVIVIDRTGNGLDGGSSWDEIIRRDDQLIYERVPFDDPLWILYSSGTTGSPKAIVHSQGSVVLEHLKWLGLHSNVARHDRFLWHSSTTWMAWNAIVSSMMLGATAVLYDGSPMWPDVGALWRVAAKSRATFFGTSGAYIARSSQVGLSPGTTEDFSALRCLMSAGSPLPIYGWHWIYDNVASDIRLDAASGGTDVCTAYVAACPLEPIYPGEVQCRALATRVEAWTEEGESVVDQIGELVVTAPIPSMPLGFWNDADGQRFHEAYFETFPGVWRHGDWITITSRGTAIVHGRSDSTINRNGVRMGSADIYAAVEQIPGVIDCLVVGAELADGDYYMPLFVTLSDGVEFTAELVATINEKIRQECSPRHIPDEIREAPEIPRTLTGKRLEVPVKRLIQGVPVASAVGSAGIENAAVLDYFVAVGAARRLAGPPPPRTG
ncbi:MAG: acetoacetate--CoA ligase [Acidimicrobiales bacterium]